MLVQFVHKKIVWILDRVFAKISQRTWIKLANYYLVYSILCSKIINIKNLAMNCYMTSCAPFNF